MEIDILVSIGRNIRDAREAKSWARFELADMIGISEELLEQYELGQKDMMIDQMDLIAKILGVPPHTLLL